ncbi:MAG: GNAT family N-acetyltransferase [Oxalobacteraceae bacterium]|nr:GNAT family N-acetyltransferase [Oxalobacteraceae bacterium]
MQHKLRHATSADLPALAELLTKIFTHDQIPIVQTAEELEEEFSTESSRIDHDVMVVEINSKIVGLAYTVFLPSEIKEERCYIFGGVSPESRQLGVGAALMSWAVDHGEKLLQSTGRTLPKFLRSEVSQSNDSAARLFARFAMKPVRYEEDLIFDLAELTPAPTHAPSPAPAPAPLTQPHANYSIIPWATERNSEALIVKNLAFHDHWGSTPTSQEHWQQLVHGSTGRPEDSFFAVTPASSNPSAPNPADKIIGLLLTHRHASDDDLLGKKIAWVDKLCTLAEYRNQSVAKNLIAAALAKYKSLGLTHAALTVDTQNPTGAYGLYSAIGFKFFRGKTTFERQLRSS